MQKENKTSCTAKNKSSVHNVPQSLKEHPFSIQVFHDENNEDEKIEMDCNSLDHNLGNDNGKKMKISFMVVVFPYIV